MANSCSKLTLGCEPWDVFPRTCGPLGWNDAGSPYTGLLGDTPGCLGLQDWAAPDQIKEATKEKQKSAATPTPKAAGDSDFIVSQGQLTFDAEGNNNPNSPYFSRQISWPGNAESGVTLGRGYDMGNRMSIEVEADLIAAGLRGETAAAFAKGAGKKGVAAQKFVSENQKTLGVIEPGVQKRLFENIYPGYVERARVNYDKWTATQADRTAWADLSPAVRDVLVDFVYQGFTKGPRPMLAGANDDTDELIEYINSNPTMKGFEPGRHRVQYLERYGDI
jgi:hypothetical protein